MATLADVPCCVHNLHLLRAARAHLEAFGRVLPRRIEHELAHGRPDNLDLGQQSCAGPPQASNLSTALITNDRSAICRTQVPRGWRADQKRVQLLLGPSQHHEERR